MFEEGVGNKFFNKAWKSLPWAASYRYSLIWCLMMNRRLKRCRMQGSDYMISAWWKPSPTYVCCPEQKWPSGQTVDVLIWLLKSWQKANMTIIFCFWLSVTFLMTCYVMLSSTEHSYARDYDWCWCCEVGLWSRERITAFLSPPRRLCSHPIPFIGWLICQQYNMKNFCEPWSVDESYTRSNPINLWCRTD